jgi:tetratricopeptide (TPR) repeat protein
VLLGYSGDARLQRQCAGNVIARRFPVMPPPLVTAPYAHDRIRLAYISSDFGYHPVTAQIVQLIEQHDRAGFEIIGVATSADDGSPQRQRIAAAFDRFHDLHGLGALEAARRIRALEVDILVDLNGHTKGDNFDILCHRPAPVQATWLGYAGTSAAPFVDHVIADRIVAADPAGFSETLALMPHCFFPTDSSRALGKAPTRAEAGLPQDGFVFCCFNNNWKITASVFAIWMRLLQQVPGSVLWLKAGDAAAANLRRAAQGAGVDPARLVFARPAPLDAHLARHQLADLFLDTLPYNAHATACDALWAGLPVLTQHGTAYAGQVAASMLLSLGLPELVTQTPQDYEALALALARDPVRLAGLRARLEAARTTAPLFDTPRFARDLEALLTTLLPQSSDAARLFRQAAALQHLDRADEALARYDQAIALRPGFAAALNNRGNVLRGLDRPAEALASFDAALAAESGHALARYNRGETLLALDRMHAAFDDFAQAARVFHADAVHDRLKPHKIAHDAEQKAWLAQQGIAPRDGMLHLEGGARLDGAALAPLDAPAITRQWQQAAPQLVVVDDLLTPQALAALRRFCLGSTVWRKAHDGGYLGAFPENGFATPLLAQIAEELRAALPAIFRDHPLLYAWAFKYDSALRGTEIHADEAAVNVNFWITPDDANRDPAHGGLVVWDKAAPLDWDFAKFNNDVKLARDFLAQSGAQPMTVPYRCNRAVIFDSDLFHETDRIDFTPGYENRRINVTLLYGRRK